MMRSKHTIMATSSPAPVQRGFTLIEMIVVLAVIAIMMSLVYPAYTRISERAKAAKDMSNLHQIGLAMQTYLNDKDQILPASTTWPGKAASPVLYPNYVGNSTRVFQSPFDRRPLSEANDGSAPVSYSINTNIYAKLGANPNMLNVVSPVATFLMAPVYSGSPGTTSSWTGTAGNAPDLPVGGGGGETVGTHINGKQISVLFCDWHTESVTFGPASTAGTFKDSTTDPLGQKHWDPTK